MKKKMAYSFTLWSFSVALIIALCYQLADSARPANPESDRNCISVKSVKKDDSNTWNSADRVFVCKTEPNQFEIYSYQKDEVVVVFNMSNIVLKEQWALSIRFKVVNAFSSSSIECTFSQIEFIRAFGDLVKLGRRISPQDFTLRGLDRVWEESGKGQIRKTLSNSALVFHQHFVDAFSTKFTFEPADGSSAERPLLQFFTGGFQIVRFRPYTDIILACTHDDEMYYILKFGDSEKSAEFKKYISSFVDSGPKYTFPTGFDE